MSITVSKGITDQTPAVYFPGCITNARKIMDRATADFNEACTADAEYQKGLTKELLELAPEKLRDDLGPAIGQLFAYGTAVLKVSTMKYGGEEETSELIKELAEKWQDAVAIDMGAITTEENVESITVHFEAKHVE